jgi:hypothetical protein
MGDRQNDLLNMYIVEHCEPESLDSQQSEVMVHIQRTNLFVLDYMAIFDVDPPDS